MDNAVLTTTIILGVLIFVGLILWTQKKRYKISAANQKRIRHHFERLPEDPKAAVLEADKILDEALKLKGFQGSMGEKLKQAGGLFTDQDGVWAAHKLRNRLAHELNVTLEKGEGRAALGHFKQALKDLGFKL